MFSKSLILINSTLGALDHDVNQKEVLPHTLSLLCKVLHSIDGLFYRGTPIVTLKDWVSKQATVSDWYWNSTKPSLITLNQKS